MVKCDNTRKKYILYDYEAEQSTTRSLQFATILIAVLLLAVVVVPHFMDVRPVKAAPTEITSIDDLYAIRADLDGDYLLMNDLDFDDNASYEGTGEEKNTKRLDNTTDDGWLPIGTTGATFDGTFDGNMHNISNLFVNRSTTAVIGLFGRINGAVVSNTTLINVNVSGKNDTGALVGRTDPNAHVYNCSVIGGTVIGYDRAGGLIGYNSQSIVESSYSTANVSGVLCVGGFVGQVYTASGIGITRNCYSTGSSSRLSGVETSIGAFCGHINQGNITNSYSTGSVHYIGGTDPTTRGFFALRTIGGEYYDAGNLFDNQTSGQVSSPGNAIGKYTVTMKTLSTFTDASWDIVVLGEFDGEIWYIDAGEDYPRLGWEYETPETSFTLSGLTDTNVTWYGTRGESVWCNSSGTGHETLQIQMTCNDSINVTHINVYLNNLSYNTDYLLSSSITMYVSSDNSSFGSLGTFDDGGSNISINSTEWNAGTMGANPFPIEASTSDIIYVRFLLAIPSGDDPPDGTYVSTGFKVYIYGNIF